MDYVNSLENNTIKKIKKLKIKKYREEEQLFIAEGRKFLDFTFEPEIIVFRENYGITREIEEKLEEPEEPEESGALEEPEESSELEESFYCPFKDGEFEQCAKIGLLDYNQLNPCDQGLLNNNFLRYGWRRYKHALIGKDTKRNCYILGVPGTYNRQEALMAGMFGFPYFKEAKCETTEMSAQEVQGHFGYWYRSINPPDGNRGNRS